MREGAQSNNRYCRWLEAEVTALSSLTIHDRRDVMQSRLLFLAARVNSETLTYIRSTFQFAAIAPVNVIRYVTQHLIILPPSTQLMPPWRRFLNGGTPTTCEQTKKKQNFCRTIRRIWTHMQDLEKKEE